MLPRKNRLKKKDDFQKILRRGGSFFSPYACVRYLDNDLEQVRFGIIVSKKEFPSAIDRNKAKRRARAIVKGKIAEISKGKDIVLTLRKKLMELVFDQADDRITELFQKSNLLKRK